MQKFDKYIIGKFLKTFFFGISIFVVIVIVFDISEKIDDFLENNVPINAIVFKYYFNFIPYFINLFSPFFIFLSVIAFSSKMALNMEFISIFNSGISLKRLYYPFFITSLFLASFSFFLGNFIIPSSNVERIEFENNYYGLIVKAAYVNDSIYLKVLKPNSGVRQLNMMYAESHFYSYKVINV